MTHYLEIEILPDPELTVQHILNALYGRLHRALVQDGHRDIGVSFPDHNDKIPSLGRRMRLHGPAEQLQALMTSSWLRGVHDHLRVLEVSAVPAGAQYRRVSRVQAKSSPSRLRRRAMRRHGVDEKAALERIPDSAAEHVRLPFVILGSRSTSQPSFPLFIQHGPLQSELVQGSFNSYSLSQTATIPWF